MPSPKITALMPWRFGSPRRQPNVRDGSALTAAGVQTAIVSTPGLVDPAAFEPLAELLARFS